MRIPMGHVVAPSGKILLVDAGLLDLWSHDRTPVLPDGILATDEETARANRSVDVELVGAGAEAVAEVMQRGHPRFMYDISEDRIEAIRGEVTRIAAKLDVEAGVRIHTPRIPHRRRFDDALVQGAGPLFFHGITAVAFEVKTAARLEVWGERMDDEPERWKRVGLSVRDQPVQFHDDCATVAVDRARLMFIDVDALAGWKHTESIDGLADFVFWGLEAAEVAREHGAPSLGDDQFGWENLLLDLALERGERIELAQAAGRRMATDFRPHSHHWELMRQVRASPTQSGIVQLGDAVACGFMTSWGDGFFPVVRELSAPEEVVAMRVEFA